MSPKCLRIIKYLNYRRKSDSNVRLIEFKQDQSWWSYADAQAGYMIAVYDMLRQCTQQMFNVVEVRQAEEVEADEDGCMDDDVDDDVVQAMLDLVNVAVI